MFFNATAKLVEKSLPLRWFDLVNYVNGDLARQTFVSSSITNFATVRISSGVVFVVVPLESERHNVPYAAQQGKPSSLIPSKLDVHFRCPARKHVAAAAAAATAAATTAATTAAVFTDAVVTVALPKPRSPKTRVSKREKVIAAPSPAWSFTKMRRDLIQQSGQGPFIGNLHVFRAAAPAAAAAGAAAAQFIARA